MTEIPYCNETWNPIVGCPLPLVSDGCRNCWARELHNKRHKAYIAGKKLPKMYAKPFEELQFFPERLEQPLHWVKPKRIFVGSQCDLFHDDVPFEWIDRIMVAIILCPQHKFMILTKRPERMLKYFNDDTLPAKIYYSSDYLSEHCDYDEYSRNLIQLLTTKKLPLKNLTLYATVCNQAEADKNIPLLLQIPAAKRGINIEPMLGDIDLYNIVSCPRCIPSHFENQMRYIDHVIVGCESGKNRRPCNIEWVRSIVSQCDSAGVPVYVKQLDINGKANHEPEEWPEDLQRRELI